MSPSSLGKVKGCSVYTHKLFPDDDADDDDDPCLTIDSPIDSIQVFQHNSATPSHGCNPCGRHPPLTRMPFAAWKQLMPEQQVLWDQLPNKAKEIIYAGTKSRNASDSQKANLHDMSAQDYLESQLKVNLMDILAHELVVNLHDTAGASTDTDPQFFDAQMDDPKSKDSGDLGSRKVMSTTIVPNHMATKMAMTPQKPVAMPKSPVASIQQVLSTALGKKPTPVKSDKPPPNPKQHDPEKEIIIGNKRYILQDEKSTKHDSNTIQ